MFRVKVFMGPQLIIDKQFQHLPRIGDMMRFEGEGKIYGTVTSVVWCMDEPSVGGQRVNIGVKRDEEEKKEDVPKKSNDQGGKLLR